MGDTFEAERRIAVQNISSEVQSQDPDSERLRLEKEYGRVWDTKELQRDFDVTSFLAPCVLVKRKSDGKSGALLFQHSPRFYWGFSED